MSRLRAVIWKAVSSAPQATDDKISLPAQDREGHQFASAHDMDIVAVLEVPGHSRWESDPVLALEDFAKDGIYAYHRLREMWQQRAFDVLICYTHSRLGRSFTMQSWVIENVIRSGARVYRIQGGWIDKVDYPFQIAMGGAMTTTEVDRLVKASAQGRHRRAETGRKVGSKPPFTHVVVRDVLTGKETHIEVDESKRRLLNDAAALVLEGISWPLIELEMYTRFGHADPKTGGPFSERFFFYVMTNPATFGHAALGHRRKGFDVDKFGAWVYDPSQPAPDYVTVYRDVYPPFFPAPLAEQLIAEMNRRHGLAGRATWSRRSGKYSGLFVCAECGYTMSTVLSNGEHFGLVCDSARKNRYKRRPACSQHGVTTYRYLDVYMDRWLRIAAQTQTIDILKPVDNRNLIEADIGLFLRDIEDIGGKLERLVREQASAPESVQHIYREQVATLAVELQILQRRLDSAQRQQTREHISSDIQRDALIELRDKIEEFWQQDNTTINQQLHKLLTGWKLQVRDKLVVGATQEVKKTVRRNAAR